MAINENGFPDKGSNAAPGRMAAKRCQMLSRIISLLAEIAKTPFKGTGKPEPLKHQLKGKWSRRINLEHRIVYEVKDDTVIILACKYHY